MNSSKKQFTKSETEKPFIHISISMPAARSVLAAFATNRIQALERLVRDVQTCVSSSINDLLAAEMDIFLGQPSESDNKHNGVRVRNYYLKGIGALKITLPRDRAGRFNSAIIPVHERIDPRTREDLAILHLAGLSNRTLALVSNRILGIEVSKSTVMRSLVSIQEQALEWLTRPLHASYWALYVDGTNFQIQRRGSTEREPSLCVLGVDERGHRSVLAIEPGTRDNIESWRSVFNELKRRGLDGAAVKVGIMDGLPGLERLFCEEFPNAVTARCWVHVLRNALAKTPARLREAFKIMALKVMYASSEASAREAFVSLERDMGTDAQRAVRCIKRDLESLLVHYRFESRYWQALKTTNAIERVNKELKRRTKSMETLGENCLMAVVAFTALRLEAGWRMHPIDSSIFENLAKSRTRRALVPNAIEGAFQQLQGQIEQFDN